MDLLLRGRMATEMVEKLADEKAREFQNKSQPELRSQRSRYEQYLIKHPVHQIDDYDSEKKARRIIMVRAGIYAIKASGSETDPHIPKEGRPYLTDGQHYYVFFSEEPRLEEYYWPEMAEGVFEAQAEYTNRSAIQDILDEAERPMPSNLYSLYDGFREKALKSRVDSER